MIELILQCLFLGDEWDWLFNHFFSWREDSRSRMQFINNLIDDRSESLMSYQEFLLHIQRQINNWIPLNYPIYHHSNKVIYDAGFASRPDVLVSWIIVMVFSFLTRKQVVFVRCHYCLWFSVVCQNHFRIVLPSKNLQIVIILLE